MRVRQYAIMGVLLISILLLAGCEPAVIPEPYEMESTEAVIPVSPTATKIVPTVNPSFGPEYYPDGMNPLTGLIVKDSALLNRCPMVIKVSNYPRSGRPHAGLSQADLVFDYYIGEGMNRFAAVFYGQDAARAGPIRSGRLVDIQLVQLYQGILAYKGAWYKVNEALYSKLKNRAISGSPATCPGICDDGAETVISMFANTAELEKYALGKGICKGEAPALQGMVFSEEIPADGRSATSLAVVFSYYNRAEWHYDESKEAYLRWIESISGEEGEEIIAMIPLGDANTGEQLAFNNVVILFVKHDMYASTYFDMQLQQNVDGARALLFRDGEGFDAIWKSTGEDRPLQFYTPEGTELAFKPGNTWFVIVGSRSTLTTPVDAMWELINRLP